MRYDYQETVTVLRVREYGDCTWPTSDLLGFLSWANGLLDKIPEEFRGTAKIEITGGHGYDDDMCQIEVSYQRPPSREEIIKRKADAKMRREEEIARAEANLARLRTNR